MKKISVITPCFNEELNIVDCANEVKRIFTTELTEYEYEHIFSDNNSIDGSAAILRELTSKDDHVKVLIGSKNVGPFRNMWNALKYATGDAVIPMVPADLQDPPSVIPSFVRAWEQGDLVVYGVRQTRQEGLVMRIFRKTYYWIIAKFASEVIPKNSGEFLLADKRVIEAILDTNDHYPYIRGLIAQTGVKNSSVNYTWVARAKGKSKNSFLQLIDQAINGFVSTSRIPARIALLLGLLISFLGIAAGLIYSVLAIFNVHPPLPGISTLLVAVFTMGGVQLFTLGLVGEYVLSIHGQVRRKPASFYLEKINIDE